jgi:RNA polymerase sigma factor (sigma-70 family)
VRCLALRRQYHYDEGVILDNITVVTSGSAGVMPRRILKIVDERLEEPDAVRVPDDVSPSMREGSQFDRIEPVDSTIKLIQRFCQGERVAVDILTRRYLPILQEWAHGRLPGFARSVNATDDLVQSTLVRVIKNLRTLRLKNKNSLLSYLRQTLLNQVRDEIRSHVRHPADSLTNTETMTQYEEQTQLNDLFEDHHRHQAYERARRRLPAKQQRLLIMRIEQGMSYEEIAADLGSNPGAIRMMIARAVSKLTDHLADNIVTQSTSTDTDIHGDADDECQHPD